jgi:hypothetical protein
MRTLLAAASLLVASLVSAQVAEDEEPDEEEQLTKLEASLFLTGEKDSNVNLAADLDEATAAQDDFVFRIRPNVSLFVPFHKESKFELTASGDFRRGRDTDLSDKNGTSSALLELHFPGGIVTRVFDSFFRGEFDLALFSTPAENPTAEPGLSKTQDHTYGAEVVYTPANRFSVQARWEHSDDKFSFTDSEEERKLDHGLAKVFVPVTSDVVAYVTGELRRQDTDDLARQDRIYDDARLAAGARWGEPEKLAVWAEAGRQRVDYEDAPGREYDRTVWAVGFDATFAETMLATGHVGKDAYGTTVYQLAVFRTDEEKTSSWRLLAQQSSQNSFSNRAISRVFRATIYSARWDRRFAEKFLLGFEGSFLRVYAENSETFQKDDTMVGRVEAGWVFADWCRLVAHYQYSKRDSRTPETRFKDRRIGASLVFEY